MPRVPTKDIISIANRSARLFLSSTLLCLARPFGFRSAGLAWHALTGGSLDGLDACLFYFVIRSDIPDFRYGLDGARSIACQKPDGFFSLINIEGPFCGFLEFVQRVIDASHQPRDRLTGYLSVCTLKPQKWHRMSEFVSRPLRPACIVPKPLICNRCGWKGIFKNSFLFRRQSLPFAVGVEGQLFRYLHIKLGVP